MCYKNCGTKPVYVYMCVYFSIELKLLLDEKRGRLMSCIMLIINERNQAPYINFKQSTLNKKENY